MPAGCDFICDNPNCEQYKNGFIIAAPWPMGQIELIISALSTTAAFKPLNKNLLDKLIEYKNEGRKYACITYPNTSHIETIAYRIQFWSPNAKCINNYDVELNGKTLTEAMAYSNLPSVCPRTNGPLLSFTEVTKEGIDCPFCGIKLKQSRWFTNEDN